MDGLEGKNRCELHIWPVSEKPKPEVLVRWQPEHGHSMAREEVTSLLHQLKLPIDERGRRRAANRAEWFNQVNKPLEVHDILGAPQIGFQTGDRLGPRA